jgi:hypothetical protein
MGLDAPCLGSPALRTSLGEIGLVMSGLEREPWKVHGGTFGPSSTELEDAAGEITVGARNVRELAMYYPSSLWPAGHNLPSMTLPEEE